MEAERIICPVCEEGILHRETYTGNINYRSAILKSMNLEFCSCDACGADPLLDDQIHRNHLKIADAKRQHAESPRG